MTPTPEMTRMAERIAKQQEGEGYGYGASYYAALTAIMETSEKAAELAEGQRTDDGSLWDLAAESISTTIRNGEHLK